VVVNCAAWTAVDEAEANEDEALLVNGLGPRLVAAACAASGARLIHMSTDYVFRGDGSRPYAEGDPTRPRTAYGRTKLVGEKAVLELLPQSGYVVRTAWLFGANGPNFVYTMTRLERERATVDVVNDQRGQPTWSADVVWQIIGLAKSRAGAGIYHATSSGETTWFGLAREIFRLLGADPARVKPATSGEFPRPAPRPAYSVLGHAAWTSAGIAPIGDWRVSLRRAFPTLKGRRP
jgi:dTDP-4-dehydrorhamnose reductase